MTDEYTPTTEEVRHKWAFEEADVYESAAEFDRWFQAEIEKAEYRGAVRATRAIVESNLAKSDHEFGEFL